MRKVLSAAVAAAVLTCVSTEVSAVMPVVDVKAIRQIVQQIKTAEQQLSTLRDQLSEAKRVYDALTGPRGFEKLLSGTARNYLPASWNDLIGTANTAQGTYSALARDVAALMHTNARLLPAQLDALTEDQRQAVEEARRTAALLQVISREGLSNASARFGAIQELIDSIPRAQDPRAISELQARIAAEQGMLANENTKLQTLYHAAEADAQAQRVRLREAEIASYGSMRDLPPMGLED